MLWMVPRGYFRDCPGQRNGEGVVVLVLVCVLFKDTQVGLLLEPRKTRGPRLSLLWLSTGAHAPPPAPAPALCSVHPAAIATASMETGSRDCSLRGASTGSPNPFPTFLLCTDAYPGPQDASQVRAGALPPRQGDGMVGEEAETQGLQSGF